MSDEEKKALERIDYIQDFIIENGQYNADVNDMEYFSRIKNLIEKQSKEIEELKKPKYLLNAKTGEITTINNSEFISKDKIKAKIKELEKEKNIPKEMDFNAFYRIKDLKNIEIAVLQSLLEKE